MPHIPYSRRRRRRNPISLSSGARTSGAVYKRPRKISACLNSCWLLILQRLGFTAPFDLIFGYLALNYDWWTSAATLTPWSRIFLSAALYAIFAGSSSQAIRALVTPGLSSSKAPRTSRSVTSYTATSDAKGSRPRFFSKARDSGEPLPLRPSSVPPIHARGLFLGAARRPNFDARCQSLRIMSLLRPFGAVECLS